MIRKDNAITLIALVITIIVLLILAAVSISAVIGENGIATKAKDAAVKTEIGKESEQVEIARTTILLNKTSENDNTNISVEELQNQMDLDAGSGVTEVYKEDNMLIVKYLESNRTYEVDPKFGNVIDWDEAIANAKVHEEQDSLNPDIGIGTDGEPVNLDDWNYYEENGEITLGKIPYSQSGTNGYTDVNTIGYIGNVVNGKIEGTIPQYIIISGTAYPVVNLDATFKGYTDLEVAPEIPSTVEVMHGTFYGCTSLVEAPKLPNGLVSMGSSSAANTGVTGTFYGCTNLEKVGIIPNTVETMDYTFYNCDNLTTLSNLPSSLKSMQSIFQYCENLTTVPSIPETVTNMSSAFYGCSSLSGTLTVNSFATYTNCLYDAATNGETLYVTAPEMINGSTSTGYLEDLIATGGTSSKIELK